jgi:hypothetical protein
MKVLFFNIWGCSWGIFVQGCRLADRLDGEPDWRLNDLGFRTFQEYL